MQIQTTRFERFHPEKYVFFILFFLLTFICLSVPIISEGHGFSFGYHDFVASLIHQNIHHITLVQYDALLRVMIWSAASSLSFYHYLYENKSGWGSVFCLKGFIFFYISIHKADIMPYGSYISHIVSLSFLWASFLSITRAKTLFYTYCTASLYFLSLISSPVVALPGIVFFFLFGFYNVFILKKNLSLFINILIIQFSFILIALALHIFLFSYSIEMYLDMNKYVFGIVVSFLFFLYYTFFNIFKSVVIDDRILLFISALLMFIFMVILGYHI